MKLGIMQPYLFPYIGYFQLINAVDKFVIHDDVQWIKGGRINRNSILVQGKPYYITLPLQKNSNLLNINERSLSKDVEHHKSKIIRQIEGAYRKAPQFNSVLPLVLRCFAFQEQNVSAFIVNTIRECCDFMGIDASIILASELNKENDLKGQSRVLSICHLFSASEYINPIGGTDLYSKDTFKIENIKLSFIKSRNIHYKQFEYAFVPNLSIIDMLMFCPIEDIQAAMKEFDLV